MLDQAPDRAELLAQLRADLIDLVDQEKARLRTERTFLQSVLDSSLHVADTKAVQYEYQRVITDVGDILGIRGS